MILSNLDLSQEIWHVLRIALALAQPLLALLVVIGFVISAAYLLTLIGTHWGDRHATSKTLLFSLAIHLFLAAGLLALIPEYRLQAMLTSEEKALDPIRVIQPAEQDSLADEDAKGGQSPLFGEIPGAELQEWTRSTSRPETAEDLQPQAREVQSERFVPAPSADRLASPDEVESTPEMAVASAEPPSPHEVPSQLRADALPKQLQPEAVAKNESIGRAVATRMEQTELSDERPESSLTERAEPALVPERAMTNLPRDVSSDARPIRDSDDRIVRQTSPQPAAPTVESIARTEANPEPVPSVSSAVARTRARETSSQMPLSGIGRLRTDRRSRPSLARLPSNSPDDVSGTRSFPQEMPKLDRATEAHVAGGGPIDRLDIDGPPELLLEKLLGNRPAGRIDGTKVHGITGQYSVEIFVKNRGQYVARQATLDETGQPFIPLRDNEVYAIRLSNNAEYEVAIDLRIDGVNCFAFSESAMKYWILSPGQTMTILGWHRDGATTTEFKIVSDSPQSAAARLNLKPSESYGLITAIVHASWPEGTSPPVDEPVSPALENRRGQQATGFGNNVKLRTAEVAREIGAPRDILSIRYERK